ncbi:MAG: WhiB family transcriptional regulator, redox-sensing transcriptional regulator [Actinomycetota bacterium]|nr:WhiB family transcriptional regulator, redox-sensing transcriptional regulator [Actinomycetota bacterium]
MSIIGLLTAIGSPGLPGARCRGRGYLFDEAEPGEPEALVAQRHAQAVQLCRGCKSLPACAAWVDSLKPSQRPRGVVAGRIRLPRSARTAGDLTANQIESTETTKGNP